MSELRFGKSYIWVTWLTGLLAGEKHCQWATWFRAHYTYSKLEGDFDAVKWREQHNRAVREYVAELKRASWTVQVEAQNAFKVTGSSAVVSGKPDIVAYRDTDVLIVDIKTGEARDEHLWQVLIYMHLLPMAWPELRGQIVRGEIKYNTRSVAVSPDELTPARRQAINEIIRDAAFDMPPERTPGAQECRWCNIGPDDCPERVASVERAGTTTEF